ncbi:LysR substrate-binding domain-containing protein [Azospirillum thermophilum]|uniref:LysR family transcriptional regulator n=1 Tax=Azospirillum thermophilum TaxID=2202148 RepID=A0A2S2CQS7_9PROT|nr:LysR substrate-binding domain-containing protein [Azospirillum thermophilum]AWK86657.1 LysR family transcriptional regulator [Azospirillum thermophilum]
MAELDLTLLRTFVSVVEAGGFTRAGERIHRTQSTISQQIRRLEESVGVALLSRDTRSVALTDEGERLLAYARRMLTLNDEARSMLSGERDAVETVRLGVPEDYAVDRLPRLLSEFARRNRRIRLDVRCDISVRLRAGFETGELDLALLKQEPGRPGAVSVWREPLCWAGPADEPVHREDPLPLVLFPLGCVYRNRAVHELDAAGRRWRMAYCSPNLSGIQAAVTAGLGVSVLARSAVPPGARVLGPQDGLPRLPDTELALLAGDRAGDGVRLVADMLCQSLTPPLAEEMA